MGGGGKYDISGHYMYVALNNALEVRIFQGFIFTLIRDCVQ